ncbi:Arrestin (or S-antigen), N-terminal domain containing protein [Novymonas esmeraldas]|uniref:Arrestin (Or S-antigen), N-terminal domain containing protein n=1 Tax=Novymonas esmeraldas TaxID=1808958 RepID=A0AAW0EQ55_9TRYP
MVFLEKDKASLSLQCETDTLTPGTVFSGVLIVDVHEKLRFTALRVRLRGREESYVRRRRKHGSHRVYRFFTHLEQLITLFGSSKEAASRSEAQLEPGTYSYPFSFNVPMHIPPSFVEERFEYGCSMHYSLKAILDIRNGFDGSASLFLTVSPLAPVGQLQAERQAVKVLPVSDAAIAKCGCECSGFCCTDAESYIRTETMVAPGMLVMAPQVCMPEGTVAPPLSSNDNALSGDSMGWMRPFPLASDPNSGTIRVRITNHTKDKVVSRCLLTLSQRYVFVQRGAKETHELKRCEWTFPNGPLGANQSAIVEVPLRVTPDTVSSQGSLIPTLSTKYFHSYTLLKITFPEHKADGTVRVDNAILLAGGIDLTNRCPPLPHVYETTFTGSN